VIGVLGTEVVPKNDVDEVPREGDLPLLLETPAVKGTRGDVDDVAIVEPPVTALSQLVLPIYLPSFLNIVAMSIAYPVIPLFAQNVLGASTGMVGLIVASQGVGKMLANIPSGLVTVSFGDRFAVCAGFATQAVAGGLMAIAPNTACLVAAELCMGISGSLLQVGRQSYMKEAVGTSLRGRALALIGGTTRVGSILGPLLGGWVYTSVSPRAALALQVVFASIGLVFTFMFMAGSSRPPSTANIAKVEIDSHGGAQKKKNEGEYEMVDAEDGTDTDTSLLEEEKASPKETTPVSLGSIWLEHWRVLCSVALYGGILFIARTARDLLLPLVSNACGASEYQVGQISSFSYFADTLLFYVSGVLMDKYGRKCNGVLSPLILFWGFLQLSANLPRSSDIAPTSIESGGSMHVSMNLTYLVPGNATTASLRRLFTEPAALVSGELTFTGLYAAAGILGLGNGVSSGLVMTLGSDVAPMNPEARGLFLGLFRMFTDGGITLGSLLVGAVAELLSLRAACAAAAASAAFAAAHLFFCVEETLRRNSQ
jgi:MFS family permease